METSLTFGLLEVWIEVYPIGTPNTVDAVLNGDFEIFSSSLYWNKWGAPLNWLATSSNNVAAINGNANTSPILNGVGLAGESGSFCGNFHVLINKPATKQFGGINQTINVPTGNKYNISK